MACCIGFSGEHAADASLLKAFECKLLDGTRWQAIVEFTAAAVWLEEELLTELTG